MESIASPPYLYALLVKNNFYLKTTKIRKMVTQNTTPTVDTKVQIVNKISQWEAKQEALAVKMVREGSFIYAKKRKAQGYNAIAEKIRSLKKYLENGKKEVDLDGLKKSIETAEKRLATLKGQLALATGSVEKDNELDVLLAEDIDAPFVPEAAVNGKDAPDDAPDAPDAEEGEIKLEDL